MVNANRNCLKKPKDLVKIAQITCIAFIFQNFLKFSFGAHAATPAPKKGEIWRGGVDLLHTIFNHIHARKKSKLPRVI